MTLTRRSLLSRGAATVLAGLAGCSGVDAPTGPPRGSLERPVHRLAPPRAVGESAHGAFSALDLAAVTALGESLRPRTHGKYRRYVELLDTGGPEVDPGAIDGLVQTFPPSGNPPRSAVLTGLARPSEFRAAVADAFDGPRNYRGVDVFDHPDATVAVGLDGDDALFGYPGDGTSPESVVRSMVDATVDPSARYVAASADLAALVDRLGPGQDLSGLTRPPRTGSAPARGAFEGVVAKGHRYRFGPERTRSRYAFVFGSVDGANADPVRAWVDANDGPTDRLFGAYESTAVSRVGRSVVVDGTLPTGAV